MTTLSTTQVSERLSVPVSTVKLWADRLGIGDRNSQGQRRFGDKELAALDIVKSLRNTDCGFDTITRQLTLTPDNAQQTPVNERQRDMTPEPAAIDAEVLAARLTAAVISATKADNELAEKYARSAHRIGELEAEVRHLTEDRGRLLTDGQQHEAAYQRQLAAIEAEQGRLVADLRTELAAERAKPWWRRLVGQ